MFNSLRNLVGKIKQFPPRQDGPANIDFCDSGGRRYSMPRNLWREQVLIPTMGKAWDDPDKLSVLIATRLEGGFEADLEAPSRRLLQIAPLTERGHAVHGAVLIKLDKFDEAESVLNAGLALVGRTTTLLTRLAMLKHERMQHQLADDLLWEAVQKYPNSETALTYWMTLRYECAGKARSLHAAQQASMIAGSWRPQLWLARHELEQKRPEKAFLIYAAILDSSNYTDEALFMMSGYLGMHGHVVKIPELLCNRYKPEIGNPQVAMNLLRAYFELNRKADGLAILGKLAARKLESMQPHIEYWNAQFTKMK